MRTFLPAAIAAMAASGCDSGPAGTSGWGGSVDTLQSGVVVVHNPAAGTWTQGQRWTASEQVRIGRVQGEGPDVFGRVTDVLTDNAGRTWVLDRQVPAIQVFDATGAWVRTIGGNGEGPGEFREPVGMEMSPDGRVWVNDPRNARFTAFDSAGGLVETRRRTSGFSGSGWAGGFDDRGALYDFWQTLIPETRRTLLRHTFLPGEVAIDTVPLPDPPSTEAVVGGPVPGGYVSYAVPYGSTFVWSFVPDGRILYGMTGEYRIHIATLDGELTSIIERDASPAPIPGDVRDATAESLRERTAGQDLRFDESMVPDHYPAIDRFQMDDRGYLWVRPYQPPVEESDSVPGLRLRPWDVFDPDGRFLGTIPDLPPDISVRGNTLTGFTVDELGVSHVLRYRIEGRPTGS